MKRFFLIIIQPLKQKIGEQNHSYVLKVELLKYICEGVPFLIKLQAMNGPANFFSEVFYLRSLKFLFCGTTFWGCRCTSDVQTKILVNESVSTMLWYKHKGKTVSKKKLESAATVPFLPMLRFQLCTKHIYFLIFKALTDKSLHKNLSMFSSSLLSGLWISSC